MNKEQSSNPKKPKRSFWKFRIALFIMVSIPVIAVVVFIVDSANNIPELEEIEKPQTDLSTQIFTADGKLIRSLYSEKHRLPVKLAEISPHVLNALIATEDIRFYTHSGIDPKSIMTVIYRNIVKGQRSGGSTISMQLARNLFDKKVGTDKSVFRKLREMITAVILERKYTKEEIIASYLNTVSFYGNTYGIENGSRIFFNKNAGELNIEESALLVGLLKGTAYYNPVNHPERGLQRRNTILNQMEKYGFISPEESDSLKSIEVDLTNFKKEQYSEGLAPYFTEHLRQWLKDWCEERDLDLYTDGLRVHTTIDSRMQRYAENAVQKHLSGLQTIFDKHLKGKEPWKKDTTIIKRLMTQSYRYQLARRKGKTSAEIKEEFDKPVDMTVFTWNGRVDTSLSPLDSLKYYARFLETGMTSIDPSNGHIKAWVGGIDHRFFKYDHVYKGKRQVGSTFKPFVYTAAFDNAAFAPCDRELNQPVFFYDDEGEVAWSPKNADGKYGGKMTLRKGLATSTNIITARVIKEIGAEEVCKYAKRMGITTELDCVPSLALGTTDLSVYELTGAYCTFVNKGVWNEPIFVTHIEDKNGNLIEEIDGEKREALNEITAYEMIFMLMGVVDERGGTAGRLRFQYHFTNQMGGKTGTTQNHSDGWFMGVTPYLVTGVWVGCSDRSVRFRTLKYGQGASLALPVFGNFMQEVYADSTIGMPQDPFPIPKGFSMDIMNCKSLNKPDEFFVEDTATTRGRSIMDFDE